MRCVGDVVGGTHAAGGGTDAIDGGQDGDTAAAVALGDEADQRGVADADAELLA